MIYINLVIKLIFFNLKINFIYKFFKKIIKYKEKKITNFFLRLKIKNKNFNIEILNLL